MMFPAWLGGQEAGDGGGADTEEDLASLAALEGRLAQLESELGRGGNAAADPASADSKQQPQPAEATSESDAQPTAGQVFGRYGSKPEDTDLQAIFDLEPLPDSKPDAEQAVDVSLAGAEERRGPCVVWGGPMYPSASESMWYVQSDDWRACVSTCMDLHVTCDKPETNACTEC